MNNVQYITCGAVALLMAGCAAEGQQVGASKADKDQAMAAYIGCLKKAAAKMDDGKSDAITVAVALKPLCAGEFARSVALSGSDLSPYARNLFEERVQASQIELGTTAVLDHRNAVGSN